MYDRVSIFEVFVHGVVKENSMVNASDVHRFVRHAFDIVRYQHNCQVQFLIEFPQESIELILDGAFHTYRRFIEKYYFRFASESPSYEYSLLLAA